MASKGQLDPTRKTESTSAANQAGELPLMLNTRRARKILQDSLPKQDISQRLLELFLSYQSSLFYVCDRGQIQAQLDIMYEGPDQVSLAWFC